MLLLLQFCTMIELHPFNNQHFDQLINWIDSPKMLYQFAGPIFNFPLTAEQLNIYISDKNRHPFSVWSTNLQKTIGHAEIIEIDTTIAKLCRLFIALPYRGQGYGFALTHALIQLAHQQLQKSTITLNVFDWNTAAINCYIKCGFQFNPKESKEFHFEDEVWISHNMIFRQST